MSKHIIHILKSNLETTKQEHLILLPETVSVFPPELYSLPEFSMIIPYNAIPAV